MVSIAKLANVGVFFKRNDTGQCVCTGLVPRLYWLGHVALHTTCIVMETFQINFTLEWPRLVFNF